MRLLPPISSSGRYTSERNAVADALSKPRITPRRRLQACLGRRLWSQDGSRSWCSRKKGSTIIKLDPLTATDFALEMLSRSSRPDRCVSCPGFRAPEGAEANGAPRPTLHRGSELRPTSASGQAPKANRGVKRRSRSWCTRKKVASSPIPIQSGRALLRGSPPRSCRRELCPAERVNGDFCYLSPCG